MREGGGWALVQAVPDFQRDLPESVRSLIRKKIAQLGEADRRLLSAAGVQGHEFDTAVVARVLGLEVTEVEERLELLDRVHGLVRRRREHEFPDGTLSLRYQFVHVLYQNALYAALQPARKAAWSAAVAQALLDLYQEQRSVVASELALLFEAARERAPAAEYFALAAENAIRLSAEPEAVVLARRGLEALRTLPDTADRAQQELRLQMTLAAALQAARGYGTPEVGEACSRAQTLCAQLGESVTLIPVLWRLALFYVARAELQTARTLAEQCLRLALNTRDPALLVEAHLMMGVVRTFLGDFPQGLEHCRQVLALYDPQRDAGHLFVYGHHPAAMAQCFTAWTLWALGYPDQALRCIREALALARELAHPLSLVNAHFFATILYRLRRDGARTREMAEKILELAQEHGMRLYVEIGLMWHGWALAEQGCWEEGVEQIRQGLEGYRLAGTEAHQPQILAMLAEAYVCGGQIEKALAVTADAVVLVRQTGELNYEAEPYRLRGELLPRVVGAAAAGEAEVYFRQAVAGARRQKARSFELRAALSLARLLQQQGRPEEARQALADVYGWFTEGFDTPDLKEARTLLEQLS